MAQRIQSIKSQVSTNGYVSSAFEYWRFQDFLTPEENTERLNVRKFLEAEIAPYINDYVERAEFPAALIEKVKPLKIMEKLLPAPYGENRSFTFIGCLLAEFARIDLGLGTFFLLNWGLVITTILELGSKEQIEKYVPRLKSLDLISGWGLTEPKFGSDASSLETSAKKVQGGYVLNGAKRWIGNGNKDLLIVWARNIENKKIEAFIVDMKSQGVQTDVIKHKLAMRIVQNCTITLTNVFVSDDNKLPKATDFNKGTGKILHHSRTFIPWLAAGICLGVYDNVAKYLQERKQFGVPIASFQLMQEKLVRIMANTQAILLFCWRTTTLFEQKKLTMGQASLAKAWCSERCREVAKLGREMFGGNGIISDNYVMKAVTDAEVVYTYEGTYDINCLIAGRELTGISAFKASGSKN